MRLAGNFGTTSTHKKIEIGSARRLHDVIDVQPLVSPACPIALRNPETSSILEIYFWHIQMKPALVNIKFYHVSVFHQGQCSTSGGFRADVKDYCAVSRSAHPCV